MRSCTACMCCLFCDPLCTRNSPQGPHAERSITGRKHMKLTLTTAKKKQGQKSIASPESQPHRYVRCIQGFIVETDLGNTAREESLSISISPCTQVHIAIQVDWITTIFVICHAVHRDWDCVIWRARWGQLCCITNCMLVLSA